MNLSRIDHFVLTVADIPTTVAFYETLGMTAQTFGAGRTALAFGQHKINLHQHGAEFEPKARTPGPGTADFCLITDNPLDEVAAHLSAQGLDIEEGPVPRTGAVGPIFSLYLRDPDGNLVEISQYD